MLVSDEIVLLNHDLTIESDNSIFILEEAIPFDRCRAVRISTHLIEVNAATIIGEVTLLDDDRCVTIAM